MGTGAPHQFEVTLSAPCRTTRRGRRRRQTLEEPPELRLSHAKGQAGHRELPPPPPPSEYPLRVVVEQEEGAENEITGKVEEPEEEPAPEPPTGVEATDRFRAKFEESLFQQLTEKGIDEDTARARAKEKAAALPARVAKPPPAADGAKGEARQWRASGLEVRSTPADAYVPVWKSTSELSSRRWRGTSTPPIRRLISTQVPGQVSVGRRRGAAARPRRLVGLRPALP